MNRRELIKKSAMALAAMGVGVSVFSRFISFDSEPVPVLNMDDVPDNMGDTFDPSGVTYSKVVPVILDHDKDKVVGLAHLSAVGSTLYARFELNGDYKGYTPAVDGRIHSRKRPERGYVCVISSCIVTAISLQQRPNCDKRIKPLA